MLKIVRVLAPVLVIALFVGACGGDGDDTADDASGSEAAAEGDDRAFCDSVVGAETAVLAAQSGGDTGELEDLMATVEETAPEEVTEQVAVVVAAVRQALESQDDSAFSTDEFATNEEEVDQ